VLFFCKLHYFLRRLHKVFIVVNANSADSILFTESALLIVSGILKHLVDKCVAGASVREICEWGDKQILEETSKVFKKEKDLKKGKFQKASSEGLKLIMICLQELPSPRAYPSITAFATILLLPASQTP
jgi:hypothetical protein